MTLQKGITTPVTDDAKQGRRDTECKLGGNAQWAQSGRRGYRVMKRVDGIVREEKYENGMPQSYVENERPTST